MVLGNRGLAKSNCWRVLVLVGCGVKLQNFKVACDFILFPQTVYVLWGSLLGEKSLAAICSGRVPGTCPPCVCHASAIVLLVSAVIPLWPRLHTLSDMFPPFVRIAPALRALGRGVSTLAAPPNRPTLVFASHVSTICPLRPTMCPHLWTLSAHGPWSHEVKFFLRIAQPTAFLLHARWSVFLAFILVAQISAFASAPYA